MNKNVILVMALPLLLDADCATSADFGADVSQSPTVLTGPLIAGWNPVRGEAAYLFAGQVDRADQCRQSARRESSCVRHGYRSVGRAR